MKTTLNIFSYILILFYSINCNSQDKLKYHLTCPYCYEKTPEISTKFDSSQILKNINLYPPIVQFRVIKNEKIRQELIYNCFQSSEEPYICFQSKSILIDSNSYRHKITEMFLSNYCYAKITESLKPYIETQRPKMDSQDSLFVIKELASIKKLFYYNLVQKYKISDSLLIVLSKYPADQHVFLDLVIYQFEHFSRKTLNNMTLTKLFVFDIRSKSLVIYNYKVTFDDYDWRKDDKNSWYLSSNHIHKVTQHYRHYLEKNHRQLNRN